MKEIGELLFLDLYNTEMVPEEEGKCDSDMAAAAAFSVVNIESYAVLFFLPWNYV